MYENYWQLSAKPFDGGADARFYYPSEVHQGALLKLRYAIESRQGGALLAGESGSGKTLLIQSLERQLAENYAPFVHLVFPLMTPTELLALVTTELGAATSAERLSADHCIRCLQNFLAENTAHGRHAVIAIDEAQLLIDTPALETLRLLTNLNQSSEPMLTLVIVGQSNLLPALDRMPAFEERLAVKCLLRPLNVDETAAYVSHRLSAAGAQRDIFTADALTHLAHLARGNPRRINRLCDLALLVGFAEEQQSIGPEQLDVIADELIHVSPDA
jgi:type II secretory pathway predicted ATPase ExeA